jgi:pyruvate/2-oxoglutarate dehydrogenase complex dihydrolipoamide acyltransferase (E2) component
MLEKREGRLTYNPIFMEACKALKDFPGLNILLTVTISSKKENINLGMAASAQR